jgi:NAD(P)-dependent dehydrogenase (short-subunit alcohol dehydrogenase family)
MKTFTHAIVLGGSSGIGAELVRQLAAAGTQVLAVGRDGERLEEVRASSPERIKILSHDLTDWTSLSLDEMSKTLGGLDLVVWSAGIMPPVKVDEFDVMTDTMTMQTNLTAAIAWLDQAGARFQGQGSGTIVGLGSVAGDRGRRGQPVYNASKAGLHTYLEGLRNRLDRHGIVVSTIKPGPVATPLIDGYGFKKPMPVDVAARKILAVADKPGDHYLVLAHRVIFAIIRLVPGVIFRRLNI